MHCKNTSETMALTAVQGALVLVRRAIVLFGR